MNGIIGFSELLKETDIEPEEQRSYIDIIQKCGAHLLTVINDVVDIATIEAGQMGISISKINVNEKIQFVHNFFRPNAEGSCIKISYECGLPPSEAVIRSDPDKILAILINLVNNAIKFTSKGTIHFGYRKTGGFLEFFVKDTGIGIRQQQIEIIFERFRQGEKVLTKTFEGTGVGLSISKAYVEMLGGKMWVESEFGKGSTFYFTVPYTVEIETKSAIKDITEPKQAEQKVKNLKVLIAEDDEASISYLSVILKPLCREILKAGSGVEAVEACRNNPDIDLVLMDIRLPDLDGYSATRQIREFNRGVVIIAQTAFGLMGDREKAILAGCDDHIAKPIRMDVLKELIQKHFNK